VDIEGFYSEDERRRASEEIEFGTDWHDAAGSRYELSWVTDTGELYVMLEPAAAGFLEDPFGDVFEVGQPQADQLTVGVIGWVADRSKVDELLAGWEQEMVKPNSVGWLTARLEQAGVPKSAPAN
jgi:hypothetical protein